MPIRITPLVKDEIYHVFNRSVAGIPIFDGKRNGERAMDTMWFYMHQDLSIRFSHYNRLNNEVREDFIQRLNEKGKLAEMYAFCFMPNHFHFLLKETSDRGIATFLRNLQNIITRKMTDMDHFFN